MTDTVSSSKRSEMMAGIKGKDTRPEIFLRRLLHLYGFRFRLHRKDLPGKPDIVLQRYKTAIFVNGCFWHGHENCKHFRLPKSRTEFWDAKIKSNIERDVRTRMMLSESGWNVIVVWECSLPPKSSNFIPDRLTELINNIQTQSANGKTSVNMPS